MRFLPNYACNNDGLSVIDAAQKWRYSALRKRPRLTFQLFRTKSKSISSIFFPPVGTASENYALHNSSSKSDQSILRPSFLQAFWSWRSAKRKRMSACNYLLKVNNKSTRSNCEIYSKLTIKTPERRQWRRCGVFIVNFEDISYFVLVFLLLTLNIKLPAGIEITSELFDVMTSNFKQTVSDSRSSSQCKRSQISWWRHKKQPKIPPKRTKNTE